MIKGIQVVGFCVGIYLIIQTIFNYKRGNYNPIKTSVLILLWTGMSLSFFDPSFARLFLPILTTQDVIMSVLVLGILTSFVLIMNLNQQLIQIEKRLTELVQNLSINNYIEETKKSELQVQSNEDI